jgi:hypothetical protein
MQGSRDYQSRHKGDIWNPPGWVFASKVTLPIGKAAAFLGVSAYHLNKNTDLWGFTVYRTSASYRYYLISELEAFNLDAPKLTASDIKRATKGGKNAIQTAIKKSARPKRPKG